MPKSLPLVSVIIPAYNAEGHLCECLDSVKMQSYSKIEIIIVNDKSTDDTEKVAKQILRRQKRSFKVINTPYNMGNGEAAFNWGLKYCRGKYVARMVADDISSPLRIEKQVSFLEKNRDCFLVGTNLELINGVSQPIGYRSYPETAERIIQYFYLRSSIANPTILFRRSEKSFYHCRHAELNDYETYYHYLSQGKKFTNIQEYLVKYRVHSSSSLQAHLRENWKINLIIKNKIRSDSLFSVSLFHRFLIFIQTMVIFTLPQNIIFKLYSIKPF